MQLRPNTRYKCGADGKSTNNCTLTGGLFQIVATAHDREENENILVEGITFRGGAATLMVSNSNVTFRDCIFTEHRHTGAVNLLNLGDGIYELAK